MRIVGLACVLTALGACSTPVPDDSAPTDPSLVEEIPDDVRALAAPSQDLSTVRISPEDGCYYYLWNGPVEATFLPLRTPQGNPICTKVES